MNSLKPIQCLIIAEEVSNYVIQNDQLEVLTWKEPLETEQN